MLELLQNPLLADFDYWFSRGQAIIQQYPDNILSSSDRLDLGERLSEGKRSLAATRSLLKASSAPMAISMKAMAPWHGLVTEVWGLSARLNQLES